MKKCFLIVAPSGSYDSYTEKPIKVFLDKEKAIKYIFKYNRLIEKAKTLYGSYNTIYESFEDSSKHEDWDGWVAVIRYMDIEEMSPAFVKEIEII